MESPFFILGFGRSGTTLLASMLSMNPEILIPVELRGLFSLEKKLWCYGNIDKELNNARKKFLLIINKHQQSIYLEKSFLYYFRITAELLEYDKKILKKVNSYYNAFFAKFSVSCYSDEIRILWAKFCIFRKKDFKAVEESLKRIIRFSPNVQMVCEAQRLLKYLSS